MYKLIIFSLLFCVNIFASSLNIAVAANVSYAMPTLIKEFNKLYPDIKINTTLASSGKLTAQILYGAPYDVFLSANMSYPQKLYDKNIAKTKPIVYAKGVLILLSSKKRDFKDKFYILKDKSIKKIAIANATTAPYGVAAKDFLENIKLYDILKPKFIYGESIAQTVLYSVKVADIGIVSKSVLYNPKMKRYNDKSYYLDIPIKYYSPIKQGIVIVKNSNEAKKFYDFILSKQGKSILDSFGYITDGR